MNSKCVFGLMKRKMNFQNFDIGKYGEMFENLKVRQQTSVKDGASLIVRCSVNKIPYHQDSQDLLVVNNKHPYENFVFVFPNDTLKVRKCVSDGDKVDGKSTIRLCSFEQEEFKNWTVEFLLNLHDPNFEERLLAICNKQRNHNPSPIVLSPGKLWNIQCRTLRHLLLKWNIPFTFPIEGTVDKYIVHGKRIEELIFRKGNCLRLTHAGNGKEEEYRPNDFDVGYARLTGKYDNYFYIFPMFVLKEEGLIGILKSSQNAKISVDIETPTRRYEWAQKYLFNFDDKDIYIKLVELINISISEPEPEQEMEIQIIRVEETYNTKVLSPVLGPVIMNPELSIDNTNRYIIGQSSLETIHDAVNLEYYKKLTPLVSANAGNNKEFHMERYGTSLALFSINKFDYGKAEICADGCASDFLYYEKDRDRCIGVQVKTTARYKGFWSFYAINKGYENLLMYFRSLEEGVSWLIPYNILREFYKGTHMFIYDGDKTRIDWKKYLVKDVNLAAYMHAYYTDRDNQGLTLQNFADINKPLSTQAQKEHTSRQIFTSHMTKIGITVEAPPLENMVYDIVIMGMKIQEKNSGLSKGGYLDVSVSKNGKDGKISYHENDFHHLLIHNPSPYENIIYLLPTDKLKEHGVVSTDTKSGNIAITVYPCEEECLTKIHNWTSEFALRYDDPNLKERILAILNKQRTHSNTPILLKNHYFVDIQCRTLHELMFKFNIPFTFSKSDMPYKYLIYEKRIQELTFTKSKGDYTLRLCYAKNNKEFKYHPDDFDLGFVILPGKYSNYFYLFPMKQFVSRNIIRYKNSQGESKITIDINCDIEKQKWALNYLFNFDDLEFYSKFYIFIQKQSKAK